MKVVVDASILVSALLRPGGAVASVLLDCWGRCDLIAPTNLIVELHTHRMRFAESLGVSVKEVEDLIDVLMGRITNFIAEEDIDERHFQNSRDLLANIDSKDSMYVAVAMEFDTMLWTVDKKLSHGLLREDVHITIDTATMRALIRQE